MQAHVEQQFPARAVRAQLQTLADAHCALRKALGQLRKLSGMAPMLVGVMAASKTST
jgi:hypothetical protein